MKKLVLLAALLGACAAETIPERSTVEALESQALVAPGGRGRCALILCLPGYQCVENCDGTAGCVPIAPKPECTTDADCRLFSDYCEGCNCVALGAGEPEPKCTGNIVQCLIDPCQGAQARCELGSCVAADAGGATF